MKKLSLLLLLLIALPALSQVGINTSTPSDAAVLDINSEMGTNLYGGLLIPKVTSAERLLIAPTAADDGMMIYLTDLTNRCLQIYDATNTLWRNIYCMEANERPVAANVAFTGNLAANETLTASYTYSDAEGDLEDTTPAGTQYTWYEADDVTGTNQTQLQSSSLNTYLVTAASVGKFISVEITPRALTGSVNGFPVQSAYQGPVTSVVIVNEVLASWDFVGNAGSETTVNAGVLAANVQGAIISRGTGISPFGNADRFNANSFTQPDLTSAITNDDYFEFTITPTFSNSISITEIMFKYERSGTGPPNAVLRSSVDSYSTDLATYTGLNPSDSGTINLSAAGITNQFSTVTFRFYFYGNSNALGSGGFEGTGTDLVITGYTN